jgi:hypothetical protein
MYQPYPSGGGQPPQQFQPPPPPSSIQTAVRLMYAGAALSAISLIIEFTSISATKRAIRKANLASHHPLTASQLNSLVTVSIALIAVVGIIGIGLWLWMAAMNRRGRSWARIVSLVFFILYTLDVLLGLLRPHVGLILIITFVTWLVALGATVFLWQRTSTEYYQAGSQRFQ